MAADNQVEIFKNRIKFPKGTLYEINIYEREINVFLADRKLTLSDTIVESLTEAFKAASFREGIERVILRTSLPHSEATVNLARELGKILSLDKLKLCSVWHRSGEYTSLRGMDSLFGQLNNLEVSQIKYSEKSGSVILPGLTHLFGSDVYSRLAASPVKKLFLSNVIEFKDEMHRLSETLPCLKLEKLGIVFYQPPKFLHLLYNILPKMVYLRELGLTAPIHIRKFYVDEIFSCSMIKDLRIQATSGEVSDFHLSETYKVRRENLMGQWRKFIIIRK